MRTNTAKAKLAEGKVVFGAIVNRYAPDGANFITISALGLLRLGAEDFRQRVEAAL